ncbi:VWA domain-containing protein, partial [Candidatus Uhrbacteria bacterium]|nr:VWA domain-containing protein [Candidatus Uhrbacteria bacterium]
MPGPHPEADGAVHFVGRLTPVIAYARIALSCEAELRGILLDALRSIERKRTLVTRGNGKAVTAGNVQATVEIGKVGERHVAYVELTAKGRKPGTRHTNLEIDTSGSMSGVIQDVAKDTTQFVYTLGPDEHVSINVFSGHDEARCIGGPTRCDEEGKKLLARAIAREVHVRSNTVFSEALRAALDVIQRFDSEDTVHNVVLFTDGCAVPSKWNPAEEERRACALARQLREHGAVLSAIGYNVYYNPDFLRRLVAESGNLGTFQHIAEIDGFETTILDIRAVTEKTTFADLMLAFRTDKGAAKRVFRTAPEVLAIGEDGTLSVRGLYEDKLACFIELTGPATSLLLRGEIDGAPIELSPPPAQLTNEHAADYLRVLGAVAFLAGDRDTAAALLEEVGEDGLAERAATAYTDRE